MSEAFIRGGDSVGNHARTLLRRVPLFAALTIAPLGLLSFAEAMNSHAGATARPFIVDDHPQTKNFNAVATHFGKRNPYLLSTNQPLANDQAHCGVVINSNGEPGLRPFDNLSFWYKGSPEARAFVTYKPSAGAFITTFLTVKDGAQGETAKDGFKKVIFDKSLFGIRQGSSIKEIAIVPPPQKDAGVFKVDGISLDGNFVNKILAAVILPPKAGPVGAIPPPLARLRALASGGAAAGQTKITLTNASGVDVYAWVQLANGATCDTTFKTITSGGNGPLPVTWSYPGNLPSGLPNKVFGYTILKAQAGPTPYSLSSIDSPGQWAGNVTFTPVSTGTATIPTTNCPSATFPCGHNQAEWSLNNGAGAGESANMSINNGVNSQVTMDYTSNGSGTAPTPSGCNVASSPCWTVSATSGAIYPTTVQNSLTLSGNNNIAGVYPFNCPCCGQPTCVSQTTCNFLYPGYPPPSCSGTPNNSCAFPFTGAAISAWGPNTNQSCQVGRANGIQGGKITITVNGFNISCQ